MSRQSLALSSGHWGGWKDDTYRVRVHSVISSPRSRAFSPCGQQRALYTWRSKARSELSACLKTQTQLSACNRGRGCIIKHGVKGQRRIPTSTRKRQGRVGHLPCLTVPLAPGRKQFFFTGKLFKEKNESGQHRCELDLKVHLWPFPGVTQKPELHINPYKLSVGSLLGLSPIWAELSTLKD